MTQQVKNPSIMQGETGDAGLIPGFGRSLEKKMTQTPVFLPGKCKWIEEPGVMLMACRIAQIIFIFNCI